MQSPQLLDNPIWHSLTTEHRSFALGDALALRYLPDIGPLSGIADQSPSSYAALRKLVEPGGAIVLFLADPPRIPAGWQLIRYGMLHQMLYTGAPEPAPALPEPGLTLRPLAEPDVPAMLDLAHLTQPGPFRTRTFQLGNFYGVFQGDKLLAMAGQRLSLPEHAEVSAVCTHPDAQGRGLARLLLTTVMADILQQGKTPFLHVLPDNDRAIRVYQDLGFALRRAFHLTVLQCQP